MKIKTGILIICSLFLACRSHQPAEDRMQQVMDRAIAKHSIHGASAAVIYPDGRLWLGTSGVSHDTVRMKPEMLFAIGSVTKNVVSALTLRLAEEGVLSLEDSLAKWLPDYPHVDNRITIRQLLNHTSGIFMYWCNDSIWHDLKTDRSRHWTPEDVMTYLQEPHFKKGEGWRYSNTNYLLMAMIIEKASQSTLSEQLRQRIWEPLNLKNAYVSLQDSIPRNQLAHVYGDNGVFGGMEEDVTFNPRTSHESIGFGSSGIFVTAENLARYTHALYTGKLLEPESLEAMMELVTFRPVANMRAYGLGVQLYDKKMVSGKKAVGHGGGNIGSTSYQIHFPDYDLTVITMINAFPNQGADVIAKGIARIALQETGAVGYLPYIPFFPFGLWLICIVVWMAFMIGFRLYKRRRLSISLNANDL